MSNTLTKLWVEVISVLVMLTLIMSQRCVAYTSVFIVWQNMSISGRYDAFLNLASIHVRILIFCCDECVWNGVFLFFWEFFCFGFLLELVTALSVCHSKTVKNRLIRISLNSFKSWIFMNVFVLDWVYSIRIDGDWDLRKYDKFDIEKCDFFFFSLLFQSEWLWYDS